MTNISEGLALSTNDDVMTVAHIVVVEIMHPPMQTLHSVYICSNLHSANSWEIWPIKHPFRLATLDATINVISTKQKN